MASYVNWNSCLVVKAEVGGEWVLFFPFLPLQLFPQFALDLIVIVFLLLLCYLFIMEPPSKKSRTLLDDDSSSDSGNESGGVPIDNTNYDFKINEEYARRFEYNKKREERQQCMYALPFFLSKV